LIVFRHISSWLRVYLSFAQLVSQLATVLSTTTVLNHWV
jgi:hypothetical protein